MITCSFFFLSCRRASNILESVGTPSRRGCSSGSGRWCSHVRYGPSSGRCFFCTPGSWIPARSATPPPAPRLVDVLSKRAIRGEPPPGFADDDELREGLQASDAEDNISALAASEKRGRVKEKPYVLDHKNPKPMSGTETTIFRGPQEDPERDK